MNCLLDTLVKTCSKWLDIWILPSEGSAELGCMSGCHQYIGDTKSREMRSPRKCMEAKGMGSGAETRSPPTLRGLGR